MKRLILVAFTILCSCGDYGKAVEENKRMNFDVCNRKCAENDAILKSFEQGLGYVKCECSLNRCAP